MFSASFGASSILPGPVPARLGVAEGGEEVQGTVWG